MRHKPIIKEACQRLNNAYRSLVDAHVAVKEQLAIVPVVTAVATKADEDNQKLRAKLEQAFFLTELAMGQCQAARIKAEQCE